MTKEELASVRYTLDSIELSIQKFSHDMIISTQESEDIRETWSNLKDKMMVIVGRRVYNAV